MPLGVPATANARGRLTAVKSTVSETVYTEFDAMGRAKQHRQVADPGASSEQTYLMGYGYDLAGNLTSEQYPSGKVVTTDYDAAGRVAGVKREGGDYYAGATATDGSGQPHPNRLRYSAHGAVEAMRLGNGLWETSDFNDRLQAEWVKLGTADGGADRWRLDYGYGPEGENNGNLRSQAITVPSVGAAAGFTASQTYTYDALNRLEAAFETGGSLVSWRQRFTYDRFGNRRLDPSDTSPDLVGPNPEIDPATNRVTGAGYQYDASGNLTAAPTSSGADSYAYDAENRLALFNGGASMNGGVTYQYDGEGRRVEKVAGVVRTVFVYDVTGRLIAEYSSEASQAGGTQYVTQDHLGSTRAVTGAGGAVRSRHDYHPFGEEVGLRGGRTGETD